MMADAEKPAIDKASMSAQVLQITRFTYAKGAFVHSKVLLP